MDSHLFEYYGTELGSPEGSTEGTTGGILERVFLYYWLGYLDVLELGTNFDNELGLSDGNVLGRTLGGMAVIELNDWLDLSKSAMILIYLAWGV